MVKNTAAKISLTILIILLIATNGWWAVRSYRAIPKQEISLPDPAIKQRAEVIAFLKFFVATVLQGEGEISFDDRLKLENMIRSINDEPTLTQWKEFVSAQNNTNAQKALKNLLEALANLL